MRDKGLHKLLYLWLQAYWSAHKKSKAVCKSLISMRAFKHLEIRLPCRAGEAQDKEVLTMYWKYEKACMEADVEEMKIRKIRAIFDDDSARKRINCSKASASPTRRRRRSAPAAPKRARRL